MVQLAILYIYKFMGLFSSIFHNDMVYNLLGNRIYPMTNIVRGNLMDDNFFIIIEFIF